MKITQKQKEAVIDLLKEKLSEKELIEKEKFIKKNQKSINNELDKIHDLAKEYTELCNRIYEIEDSLRNLVFHNNPNFSHENIREYNYDKKVYVYKGVRVNTKEPSVKFSIEYPNFTKIERELELASLGKDFDVENFLKKYLEN